MKVTLQDIADDTGYSVSTVSRVLNGSGKISQGTRNDILKSAEKLNYPLSKIKGSQLVQTPHIVLVTDFHVGEFYASYFYGFHKASHNEDIRISLVSIEDPHKEAKNTIHDLTQLFYDGMILFLPELTRPEYQEILDTLPEQYPVVSNALIESPIISTITFDGYSGGHAAAKHFSEQGYRKVGIIKGPYGKAESRFRYNGFNDYILQDDKLELVWESSGDFEFDSGVEAYYKFKDADDKPEAVFASADLMCHGFMEAAQADGVHFPDDVALLGYDDLPMCLHNHPKISSIHTNFEQLGRATIQELKACIQQPDRNHGTLSLIPVSLVHRETT